MAHISTSIIYVHTYICMYYTGTERKTKQKQMVKHQISQICNLHISADVEKGTNKGNKKRHKRCMKKCNLCADNNLATVPTKWTMTNMQNYQHYHIQRSMRYIIRNTDVYLRGLCDKPVKFSFFVACVAFGLREVSTL